MKKISREIGPTKILLISVILIIILGAIILKLPICNQQPIRTIDTIFLATSATCITGLTTIIPAEQLTVFGQVILLVLIQIGGIGLMTLIATVLIAIGKKINLSDKIIIRESLNQNSFKGLATLIKKICTYTFILEAIGACILAIRFIPDFGVGKGIWMSIFHSISAFCNAGFDLLGNSSMTQYSGDWIVCLTLMMLIIIGGLGFTVWDDIVENIKKRRKFHQLTVHTKLVLVITAILLISGTIFMFVLEFNNVQTMKNDVLGTKLLKSAFQATTLRTAGFYTIDQSELTSVSKLISICMMFIGGSPVSTAGGIKTTTLGVIILLVINYIKGREEINVFNIKIPSNAINKAIVLISISIFIIIMAISTLLITENFATEQNLDIEHSENVKVSIVDIVYEVLAAVTTVGISLGVTSKLTFAGKIVIMLLMIIGRLGPITISIALFKKHKEIKQQKVQYPKGNIIIG